MNLFTSKVSEIRTTYINPVPIAERVKLNTSLAAFEYLQNIEHLTECIDYVECFYCLYLNRRNHVLGVKLISQGGTCGTVVDPKIVFQNALKVNACAIILCHNHPSGEPSPSEADKALTGKLHEAGKYLDLPIIDHMIICREKYFSFADEGLII